MGNEYGIGSYIAIALLSIVLMNHIRVYIKCYRSEESWNVYNALIFTCLFFALVFYGAGTIQFLI